MIHWTAELEAKITFLTREKKTEKNFGHAGKIKEEHKRENSGYMKAVVSVE